MEGARQNERRRYIEIFAEAFVDVFSSSDSEGLVLGRDLQTLFHRLERLPNGKCTHAARPAEVPVVQYSSSQAIPGPAASWPMDRRNIPSVPRATAGTQPGTSVLH